MLRTMRVFRLLVSAVSLLVLGCGSDDSEPTQPEVVYPTETLAELEGFETGGAAPFGIAMDEANLYVSVFAGGADTGAVFRLPKAGGTPESLVPAGSSRALALANDTLFFDNIDAQAIQTVPTAGGDVSVLTSESPATEIAVSGSTLVFANTVVNGTSTVGVVDTSVGEVTSLLETDERPSDVAIDGDTVYIALLGPGNSTASEGSIVSVPVTGGEPTPVASFLAGPRALLLHGDTLYATTQGEGPSSGELIAVDLSSGSTTRLIAHLAKPWGIAADDTNVYWLNRGRGEGDGTVMYLPHEGGSYSTLANKQGEPRQIVVDDTHIYWTNYRSGQVMRVEKPDLDA